MKQSADFYQSIPKVDLHRHLEGSVRLATLREVSRTLGLDLPGTARLRSLVEIQEEEPNTFQNFLSKFETLRKFYRSQEIISRITREAFLDAAEDGLRYLELRFTPVALSRVEGFSLSDVIDWVVAGAKQAEQECGIGTGLIVSVNRHESPQLAEKVVLQAVDRRENGIVGVDLAGNEAEFSALPFMGIFREARQAGLHITIHAGEWGSAKGVEEAIEQFGAERIGHGIRVIEDPATVSMARERGIVFEVCITSNCQSGAASSLESHPISQMLAAGLKVTLNTDDPSISRITLSDEYRLAGEMLGLGADDLRNMVLEAANAVFLPEERRLIFLQHITAELSQLR